MSSLKDQAASSACSEDEARINNECSRVLQGDFGHEPWFHYCSLSCLEPISAFLIKTGESSSPVQWSNPVNSDTQVGVTILRRMEVGGALLE